MRCKLPCGDKAGPIPKVIYGLQRSQPPRHNLTALSPRSCTERCSKHTVKPTWLRHVPALPAPCQLPSAAAGVQERVSTEPAPAQGTEARHGETRAATGQQGTGSASYRDTWATYFFWSLRIGLGATFCSSSTAISRTEEEHRGLAPHGSAHLHPSPFPPHTPIASQRFPLPRTIYP